MKTESAEGGRSRPSVAGRTGRITAKGLTELTILADIFPRTADGAARLRRRMKSFQERGCAVLPSTGVGWIMFWKTRLPHCVPAASLVFVTWRLAGTLPQS